MSTIRLAEGSDVEGMLDIYGPIVERTAISFEEQVPSEDAFRQRVLDTLVERPWLVAEIDGGVAGYAYAARHRERAAYRWSVEVSVYVHDRHRRRRLATALYSSLLALLDLLGFRNAYAVIVLPSASSVALHESIGFRPVGVYRSIGYKAGRWHDVGWWGRVSSSPDDPPREPLRMVEAQALPGWGRALSAGLDALSAAPGGA